MSRTSPRISHTTRPQPHLARKHSTPTSRRGGLSAFVARCRAVKVKTVINLLAFVLFLFWLGILVGLVLVNVAASIWCAVAGLHAAIIGWQAHRKWLREETRPLRVLSASSISIAAAADNLPPVLPARLFDASDQTPDAVYCPQCVIEESHGWVYEPVGDPVYCVGHRYSTLAHAHRRLRANGGEIA